MDQKSEYVLKFYYHGENMYWIIELTHKEFQLLIEEVEHYNEWIKLLYKGLAPVSSYFNREDADQWYLANENYPERAFYQDDHEWFAIYPAEYEGKKLLNEDGSEEHGNHEFSLQTLQDIITSPLSDEFGMGYRLLPMTTRIVGN